MFECPFYERDSPCDTHHNSLHELLIAIAELHPTRKCLGTRVWHADKRGAYRHYSYSDTVQMVAELHQGLKRVGFKKGDYIGVLSQNRTEWTILDVACSALGCILVPMYDTQSQDDFDYVLEQVGLRVVFCELSMLVKYGVVLQRRGLYVYLFDDSPLDRLYLYENSEQLKFDLPRSVSCVEKPGSYFAALDEAYCTLVDDNVIDSPQSTGIASDGPSLESKYDAQTQTYHYRPGFDSTQVEDLQSTFRQTHFGSYANAERFLSLAIGTFRGLMGRFPMPKHSRRLLNGHPLPINVPQFGFQRPSDSEIYTIIFTSGTTHRPKAVLLSHRNAMTAVESLTAACLERREAANQDSILTYLPLAHVFARALQGACFHHAGRLEYADAKPQTLGGDIQVARPTIFPMVPKIVERIAQGIRAKLGQMGLFRRLVFALCYAMRERALRRQGPVMALRYPTVRIPRAKLDAVYRKHYGEEFNLENVLESLRLCASSAQALRRYYQLSVSIAPDYAGGFLLSKARTKFPTITESVFAQFRKLMGGRVWAAGVGSAALEPSLGRFFRICFDFPLFQGYGLSETTAAGTLQSLYTVEYTGVGCGYSKCAKIFLRDTSQYSVNDRPFPRGEIVIAGDAVSQGYLAPTASDEADIAEMTGILHLGPTEHVIATGDVGRFNFITGELEIIDRLRNVVKLSQGEFVQLVDIERAVLNTKYVAQCYAHARSFMSRVVVVVSVFEVLPGVKENTPEAYLNAVRALNKRLPQELRRAGLREFQIPCFFVLDFNEWTPDNNMLTPAMKVKRGACADRFGAVCEQFYKTIQTGRRPTDAEVWQAVYGCKVLRE